jgi:hypothetical protein
VSRSCLRCSWESAPAIASAAAGQSALPSSAGAAPISVRGAVERLVVGVDDVEAARSELAGGGIGVSEVFRRGRRVPPPGTMGRVTFTVMSAPSADSQPGFLDRVVGLAERAEHPIGDRSQVRALRLEALRQELVGVHRSHLVAPSAACSCSEDGRPRSLLALGGRCGRCGSLAARRGR